MMGKRSCAIIGEPPMCFPWGFDEEDERCCALKLLMLNKISLLQTQGIEEFLVPMDPGVGLYAAEIVLGLREMDPNLELTCIVPHEEQTTKWTPELRNRYFSVLADCTSFKFVSREDAPLCALAGVLDAIDRADAVVSVQNEEATRDALLAVAQYFLKRADREAVTILAPKWT